MYCCDCRSYCDNGVGDTGINYVKYRKNMNTVNSFRVDELYTNDQIRFSLGLENLGGIRPSLNARKNLKHLAIMTSAEDSGRLLSENPYHDRIENDILIYTAQGREGDQQLVGRNKRLIEQYSIPVPFFGFINVGKQIYRFLGLLELLRHYQENQADVRGTLRKVWIFEFKIHSEPSIVNIDQAHDISSELNNILFIYKTDQKFCITYQIL